MYEYKLAPQPRSIRLTDNYLTLEDNDIKQIDNFTLGKPVPSSILHSEVTGKAIENMYQYDWYSIEITYKGIKIYTIDKKGLYYAFQTLKQLCRQTDGNKIPCGNIEDWADFKVRGVLYDVSRDRVPKMDTLKMLIDTWAEWKYNQLQLYIEHTFAYSQHKKVWEHASPFTAEEISEINSYCKDRAIELVPNQNSFGHMERWLAHKEYHYLAESPDGFIDPWGKLREVSSTIAPVVDETVTFLSDLYDELLPNFDSEYLTIGGDEPWELGKGRSKALCEQKGVDRVYLDFLSKLYDLAKSKDKKIQIYGDIIMKYPHLVNELPKDIVLVNWGYEADHPFESECTQIAKADIPFYVCTGTSAWNSIGGRWENTRENIINGAKNGKRFGAEGFIVSEWGDNGHWQQLIAGLPGFLFGGCVAWNSETVPTFDPETYFAFHLFEGNRTLAKALLNLQNVWEQPGVPLHNASLPALLLLDPVFPYYREEFEKFRNYCFEKELALIDETDALLKSVDESGVMNEFYEEIRFTSELLRHGCNLGRSQLTTTHLKIDEVPKIELSKLLKELQLLIQKYHQLWNKRSRPGGYTDSVARLERLQERYQEALLK
jgi:hypothetical protein